MYGLYLGSYGIVITGYLHDAGSHEVLDDVVNALDAAILQLAYLEDREREIPCQS